MVRYIHPVLRGITLDKVPPLKITMNRDRQCNHGLLQRAYTTVVRQD